MKTQDELRIFDRVVRSLSARMTLEVDSLILNQKTPELVSKEIDLIARELICIAGTIKNTAYELKVESRQTVGA